MALNSKALVDAVVSHALALGLFERVNAHNPVSNPGTGLTVAVWAGHITPAVRASGLAVTSARVELLVRVYSALLADPPDAIDPNLMQAVDELLTAYSGDFTLGGTVMKIDLLGAHGQPLAATAGYIPAGDALHRVMTIVVPIIVADAWNQEA